MRDCSERLLWYHNFAFTETEVHEINLILFNHGILQLYETTQEHKGTILTLQEKLESIERLEDANNQNVLLITEEGLFSTRASEGSGCQHRLTREGGLLEREGFFRQGYHLSKRIHLREGFIRERGLTREGDQSDRGTILVKGLILGWGLLDRGFFFFLR